MWNDETTRQDKTTLFNQGSPISCNTGILRGPGFNKTYICGGTVSRFIMKTSSGVFCETNFLINFKEFK